MYALQKSKAKASSRRQIDIRGVQDNVLILSRNRYRVILRTSSVNFELKSEDEQDAIIETYRAFLNSLSGNIQIIIRIRELDMDEYLSNFDIKAKNEKESIYKKQINDYQDFVRTLIHENKILTRQFYVVVPYDVEPSIDFETVKDQLYLKSDLVRKGLARMGMQSTLLTGVEILDLFYSFYNPEAAKMQPLHDRLLRDLHGSVFLGADL